MNITFTVVRNWVPGLFVTWTVCNKNDEKKGYDHFYPSNLKNAQDFATEICFVFDFKNKRKIIKLHLLFLEEQEEHMVPVFEKNFHEEIVGQVTFLFFKSSWEEQPTTETSQVFLFFKYSGTAHKPKFAALFKNNFLTTWHLDKLPSKNMQSVSTFVKKACFQ